MDLVGPRGHVPCQAGRAGTKTLCTARSHWHQCTLRSESGGRLVASDAHGRVGFDCGENQIVQIGEDSNPNPRVAQETDGVPDGLP